MHLHYDGDHDNLVTFPVRAIVNLSALLFRESSWFPSLIALLSTRTALLLLRPTQQLYDDHGLVLKLGPPLHTSTMPGYFCRNSTQVLYQCLP
jgi:hypothetical protein